MQSKVADESKVASKGASIAAEIKPETLKRAQDAIAACKLNDSHDMAGILERSLERFKQWRADNPTDTYIPNWLKA